MIFFELEPKDISELNDGDLRELVARLCEADLIRQGISPFCVQWGGAQEAADGGLDVRVSNAAPLSSSGFVRCEHTGFQVKKHSMSKAACSNEMLDKGSLKPVIADLLAQKGAYIIVSGKDDCSDRMLSERIIGMKSAVSALPNNKNILLDFYGRDRLSTWLREFPSVSLWVRSKLGKPLSGWKPFERWTFTLENEDDFLTDKHPCVLNLNANPKSPISISAGIQLVREKLHKSGSVVRITGLSGVGKTRFAQALFESKVGENALPYSNVIYADLGDDLNPTASELITYLIANDFSSYVVLDNCPPDVHRKLQKQVALKQAKLSLLTIEYDISDDRPEETEVIHIEPSSEELVSKLIQKRFPTLGQTNANKISEFSGGNARLAIALADRVDPDETLTNFSDEDLFQRLFYQRKGKSDSLLESAEILSLVYSFNVSQAEFNDELSVLARIGGVERNPLHRHQAELLRRQLAQKRGNWRAVLPHALANRLARRALQNIPLDQINAELFKQENLRLFKSCAHRLGYLHDFEPAQKLALSWLKEGAPFHNIAECSGDLLEALEYIAPIFPTVVLSAIESASLTPDFCSRDNENFYSFVQLLRKIAYEDQNFDRATELILRFAETEKSKENHNSTVDVLSSLFSLYLSGTQATPTRRLAFVKRMLSSNNPKQLEIVQALFRSALETSHWSYWGDFDFGAHNRDFGWEPQTDEEKLDWYVGFLTLLTSLLDSSNASQDRLAKDILATHFVWLWSYVTCFDILENIVRQYAVGGKWPDMWRAIKKTIRYNGATFSPEILASLEVLERLAAPADPYSEIQAYVLTNTWDHLEAEDGDYSEKSEKIKQKLINLGELVGVEPEYLERLAPRLWEKHIDSFWAFGKGLAKGSSDKSLTFQKLIHLMQEQQLEVVEPILFRGFIAGVYNDNPDLARQLQESVLDVPKLKSHFIYILSATPITPWGAEKLLELAKTGDLEAWRYQQIGYGRAHESISDDDLAKLLSVLNDLKYGIFATLEILSMRFFIDKDSNYAPNDNLRAVGRESILKIFSLHSDEIKGRLPHGIDRVISVCLSEPIPDNEIHTLVELICVGVEGYRLNISEIEKFTDHLVKKFSKYFLDRVFKDNETNEYLSYSLFKPRSSRKNSVLNTVPIEQLIKWCGSNQNKIQDLAKSVSAYAYLKTENTKSSYIFSINDEYSSTIELSSHILSLLEVADDKAAIVETIFHGTFPSSWSGSLADILEIRSKAFSKLLDHDSSEVREVARINLALLQDSISRNRQREAERDMREEQRFE